jgi:hypothetical protein
VLDSALRLPVSSKLVKNYIAGIGKQPWVVTRSPLSDSSAIEQWESRRELLLEAGAKIIYVEGSPSDGNIASIDQSNAR